MIDFKKQIDAKSFQDMADLQDVINEQRKVLLSGNLDLDSLLLSNEAIAEAAGVQLEAQFQPGESVA
jgi:hypothetical protein